MIALWALVTPSFSRQTWWKIVDRTDLHTRIVSSHFSILDRFFGKQILASLWRRSRHRSLFAVISLFVALFALHCRSLFRCSIISLTLPLYFVWPNLLLLTFWRLLRSFTWIWRYIRFGVRLGIAYRLFFIIFVGIIRLICLSCRQYNVSIRIVCLVIAWQLKIFLISLPISSFRLKEQTLVNFGIVWEHSQGCIGNQTRRWLNLSIILTCWIFKRIFGPFKGCILVWLIWNLIVKGDEGWNCRHGRTFDGTSRHSHPLLFNFPLIRFLLSQKGLQVCLEGVKRHLATQLRMNLLFDFKHVHFGHFARS